MLFDGSPHLRVRSVRQESSRRRRAILAVFALFAFPLPPCCAASGGTSYDLTALVKPGQTQRVRLVVEVTGELKLNADGKRVNRLPLRVQGELLYDERVVEAGSPGQRRNDVRQYHEASATIEAGGNAHRSELRKDRRLAVAGFDGQKSWLFSPLGPLTRDELELIDQQGSSTVVSSLLPGKPVELGGEWTHDSSTMAQLLGVDATTSTDVKSTLRQVDGHVAIIDMKGSVSAAVAGVSTDIELQAKYNFDLEKRRITWLAMSLSENRAIGHAEPGFEVTARLRMATVLDQPCPDISSEALRDLSLEPRAGSALLELLPNPGGFRFVYTRSWHVMVDRHDVTIMRLLDQGDLIAQCNASAIPSLPAGQQVPLDAFQADIQRALGKNFGEFVEASQSTTEQGLRALRAVVSGTTAELPIQWTYYHLSDDQGHRVALVFTLDARLVQRFAEADRTIISSLAFAEPPTAQVSLPVLQPAGGPGSPSESGTAEPPKSP